ncbi:MAG: UDP-2,4-diacetamido-2,4,6-trideoxy-beta-L-altropyranose hydrolase [Arcobacteraceae bacterium]|jgi:UDP-2,4-diacetamido-2,4,6-trideoxy-beta-L-altropyranose hydrolase
MSSNIINILFRADSSSTIGTGHIMRDLVLATQYKDATITFVTQNLDGNISHKITEAGYKLKLVKSNDIEELDKLIKKLNINLLVIDHYGIDYKFEKKLKIQNPKLKILALDDTYLKHQCDIVLNHNISANMKRYKGLLPKHCELRCGSKYTLLREEFYIQKNKIYKPNKKKRIFLAMGGADHSNKNIKILKVLNNFKDIKVNLVTTNANKNLKKLKKYVENKEWIKLHINSNSIAKLMKKSDFSIVTPSVTLNEIFFLNIPFIAIKTADNQIDMYNYLKKNKKFVLNQFDKMKLKSIIKMSIDE